MKVVNIWKIGKNFTIFLYIGISGSFVFAPNFFNKHVSFW